MKPTPLLIVGDNPRLPGGLSRICRDLATLACTLPEFRVGVLGRGLGQHRGLPFTLYDFPESEEWGQRIMPGAWKDFAGGEPGIIMTTDDPSRRMWFALPEATDSQLMARFVGPGRDFAKWGYFPIDSTGPDGHGLPHESRVTVQAYDRVLAASEWGRNVLRHGGRKDADWLPHGLHMDKFHPTGRAPARLIGWDESLIYIGCVMANQSRKDFPALFEAAHALKQHWGNRFRLWLHTDTMIRYWNIQALMVDYGLLDCVEVTTKATDEILALRYSACAATVLPTACEGFGYPIAESLACGTPCVVVDYAAGQELVSEAERVAALAWRIDTSHNVRRAVLSGFAFAQAIIPLAEEKMEDWEAVTERCTQRVEHLSWDSLRHLWARWFLEGIPR